MERVEVQGLLFCFDSFFNVGNVGGGLLFRFVYTFCDGEYRCVARLLWRGGVRWLFCIIFAIYSIFGIFGGSMFTYLKARAPLDSHC